MNEGERVRKGSKLTERHLHTPQPTSRCGPDLAWMPPLSLRPETKVTVTFYSSALAQIQGRDAGGMAT